MREGEFAEVLRYLQASMNTYGFPALNARILESIREAGVSPARDLLAYLTALRNEVSLGSDETARQVVRRFREVVTTPGRRPVNGIRLELSPADAERFGIEGVDYGQSPQLEAVLAAISSLIGELRESDETRRDNR